MEIASLRSSSYTGYDFCQQKYYLEYVLGYKLGSNRAALKGCCYHKAIELFALEKVARQTNKTRFVEDESGRSFKTGTISAELAALVGVEHYNKIQSDFVFDEKDEAQITKWLESVEDRYHPSYNKVLAVEKFFELEIDEDWAILEDGKPLKLMGTVDLILERSDRWVNYVDWKTGQRKDWATGEVKTLDKLEMDPQLRIYHYAMCKLFPHIEKFDMTVYYLADGGPFTIELTQEDVETSLNLIKNRFFEIKNNNRPRPIWPDWKCSKLCEAGKPMNGRGKNLCQLVSEDMIQIGIEEVTEKWRKGQVKYSGGGRQ